MPSTTTNRRLATLVGIAAPTILVTNIAFAAWTTNGEGTGQANAGTAVDLTVSVATVDDTDDMLYPTTSGNIRFTVTNTNPYAVDIEAVTFGTVVADEVDPDDVCNASSVSFDDVPDLGMVVGANSSLNVELVDAAEMSNDADDDCQGATFTAPVTITGLSTAEDASDDDF